MIVHVIRKWLRKYKCYIMLIRAWCLNMFLHMLNIRLNVRVTLMWGNNMLTAWVFFVFGDFYLHLFYITRQIETHCTPLRILTDIHTFDKTLIHSTKHKNTMFGWRSTTLCRKHIRVTQHPLLLHNHFIYNIVHTKKIKTYWGYQA